MYYTKKSGGSALGGFTALHVSEPSTDARNDDKDDDDDDDDDIAKAKYAHEMSLKAAFAI